MLLFKNARISLWEYEESSTKYNVYGEPLVEYRKIGDYSADFQPKNPSETLKEFGEVLTDTYTLYVDEFVPLSNSMLVKICNDTYEVIGSIEIYNTLLKHKRATIQKQRKATPLFDGDFDAKSYKC